MRLLFITFANLGSLAAGCGTGRLNCTDTFKIDIAVSQNTGLQYSPAFNIYISASDCGHAEFQKPRLFRGKWLVPFHSRLVWIKATVLKLCLRKDPVNISALTGSFGILSSSHAVLSVPAVNTNSTALVCPMLASQRASWAVGAEWMYYLMTDVWGAVRVVLSWHGRNCTELLSSCSLSFPPWIFIYELVHPQINISSAVFPSWDYNVSFLPCGVSLYCHRQFYE